MTLTELSVNIFAFIKGRNRIVMGVKSNGGQVFALKVMGVK